MYISFTQKGETIMGKKLKHIFIVEACDYCKCNIDDMNE